MLLAARAEQTAEGLMAAGVAEFTAAYQAWDGRRFGTAADLFRQASGVAPRFVLAGYWQGAAEFHQMLYYRGLPPARTNRVVVAKAMDAAIAALEGVLLLDSGHAESHALLGTLYGMKIDGHVFRGLRFGPRVEKHRQQALRRGADNPRVQYLLGMCLFHTAARPEGHRQALAALREAERLFAAEAERPRERLAPAWGRSSCLTFIGRCHEQLGEWPEAAAYYRRALAEHPGDYLAQEGLARVARAK
jgi:tetratricopeptide (TPR) repeat protein